LHHASRRLGRCQAQRARRYLRHRDLTSALLHDDGGWAERFDAQIFLHTADRDGGAVLHWPAGANGKGALPTGDIIQVVQDRRYVSFMRSYANLIPLGPAAIQRILKRIEPFSV
jgi:hypothetical protein